MSHQFKPICPADAKPAAPEFNPIETLIEDALAWREPDASRVAAAVDGFRRLEQAPTKRWRPTLAATAILTVAAVGVGGGRNRRQLDAAGRELKQPCARVEV